MLTRPVEPADLPQWVAMRALLWPDAAETVAAEVATFFRDGRVAGQPHGVFVAEAGTPGRLAGFIEVSLQAASPARAEVHARAQGPIGHVEGWFVEPQARRAGVGRALLRAAEAWCVARGCVALGSDTREPWAAISVPVHLACGFRRLASTWPTGEVGFTKAIR